MSKCAGCGKEYNYIYQLCPACRGATRNDVLDHIDDGVDLDREQRIIHGEINEQERRDCPQKPSSHIPRKAKKGYDLSKIPYPDSILKKIAENKKSKIIDVGDEDNGIEKK